MSALLMPNEILSMTAQAARRVVELGDGDCALLYLALLEKGGDGESAARALNWPVSRINGAWDKLAAHSLVAPRSAAAAPVPVRREEDPIHEYNRSDILLALEKEPEFVGLTLSDADLKSLYTVYDHLALPAEVILLLTNYVIHTLRRQKGMGSESFPRMPRIRKEAFLWKRLGVDTVEKAEEYIRSQQQVDGREWAILSAVGVTERRPAVEKEREYITQWVEMGLDDRIIRLAYERTVYRKGCMNWPYMNRILQSWHQSGYRTVEQVEEGDRPASRQTPRQAAARDFQPSSERIRDSSNWLDQFLREQEKGE